MSVSRFRCPYQTIGKRRPGPGRHTQLSLPVIIAIVLKRLVIGLLPGSMPALPAMAAETGGGFQYHALFKPTQGQGQLSAGARKRVMTTTGWITMSWSALDTRFNRIEHMMFIRTGKTRRMARYFSRPTAAGRGNGGPVQPERE